MPVVVSLNYRKKILRYFSYIYHIYAQRLLPCWCVKIFRKWLKTFSLIYSCWLCFRLLYLKKNTHIKKNFEILLVFFIRKVYDSFLSEILSLPSEIFEVPKDSSITDCCLRRGFFFLARDIFVSEITFWYYGVSFALHRTCL